MQVTFILAALGAASVAVATPVPGPFDHIACGKFLGQIKDALGVAVFDAAKVNAGQPPATLVPLLQSVQDKISKDWEIRNGINKRINKSDYVATTNTLVTVAGMLNGTDIGSTDNLAEVTKIQTQFTLLPDFCELDESD